MFSQAVSYWIAHYGYAGLFTLLLLGIVGLPVPDETLLVYAGYLIGKGELAAVPTYLIAFCGSACGITISYLLGRSGGYYLAVRFGGILHLGPEKLENVHRWYARAGKWLLTVGYFFMGVRHLTAIVAGASRLEWRTFALFAYAGAMVWSAAFISAGWWFGKRWHIFVRQLHGHLLLVTVVFIVTIIIYTVIRKKFFTTPPGDRNGGSF
jgi:membrane protein DedA with SNARE-associated domain